MVTWWDAVCDEHKEICSCFVKSPIYTGHVLEDYNDDIFQWFQLHYNCKLRLIHHDCDLDECWEKGYKHVLRD